MPDDKHGSGTVELPTDLDIVVTRDFPAPIQLVFDVLTKPEHMRKTIAPFGEEVKVCSIDLRPGGDYHYVFVPDGGSDCSFRGTFAEVEEPTRTVASWQFDGWPDVQAVESFDLHETNGGTTVKWTLTFSDRAGRDHMSTTDGIEANFENMANYLKSLPST